MSKFINYHRINFWATSGDKKKRLTDTIITYQPKTATIIIIKSGDGSFSLYF